MKKSLLILSTLMCVITYGQKEFATFGATWYYSKRENFAGSEGYIKIVSEKDTIIEGKQSKILTQKYYSSEGDSSTLNNLYVYQSGDTAYYWIDNDFRILYNFSLEKGDTMEIYSKEIACPGNESHTGKIKVDTIVNVLINGVELKKFFTSPTNSSAYKFPGPFVEIIGCLNGIYPVDTGCSADVFPEIGNLRCYFDSSFGHYHVPGSLYCDSLLNNIKPKFKTSNLKVYYSSDSKTFSIDLNIQNLSGVVFFKVLDITGKNIFSSIVQSTIYQMNIPVSISGIYVLQIFNNQNLIYHEKIYAY
jgi:hypothetical protein